MVTPLTVTRGKEECRYIAFLSPPLNLRGGREGLLIDYEEVRRIVEEELLMQVRLRVVEEN